MGRKPLEYALYKGEQIVAIGTIREIAKERNLKPGTIEFYKSKVYKRRTKDNNAMRLVRIDD